MRRNKSDPQEIALATLVTLAVAGCGLVVEVFGGRDSLFGERLDVAGSEALFEELVGLLEARSSELLGHDRIHCLSGGTRNIGSRLVHCNI